MTNKDRVPLGRSGMEISRVGLGTWGLGAPAQVFRYGGEQTVAVSVATVLRAVELEVNWIDTAPIYGWGTAEERIGHALRQLDDGERPYVFTKCGLSWATADQGTARARFGAAERIRADVEGSLRRLGVERLDLLYMHHQPQDGTTVEDYWSTLLDLKREGKVREIGLSNHSTTALTRAQSVGDVAAVQTAFSAIDRLAASDVIPWCAENESAVMVWGALHSGLLAGSFDAEGIGRLADDDWRRGDPDFTERLATNLSVAAALREVANRHGVSVPAAAIAWALAWPGVTAAVAGARRPDHLDGVVESGALELDVEDLEAVAHAVQQSGAGQGPAKPGAPFDPADIAAPLTGLHTSGRA